MELPYFIIKELTPLIKSSAKAKGWNVTRQENFQHETVYEFQSEGSEAGRLVVSDQEFKDIWVLEDSARLKAIEGRLFAVDGSDEEHFDTVIRESQSYTFRGPVWIGKKKAPDGAQIFTVTAVGSASLVVQFSAARLGELFAMPPRSRYHAAAEEVRQAFVARK